MKLFGGKGHNSNNGKRAAQNKRQKQSKGKIVLRVLIIILLSIALIAGGFVLYWKITTKPPVVEPPDTDPEVNEENKDPEEDVPYTGTRYFFTLVVGEDQLEMNTDTIMVLRYDAYENKANVLSIPRDTLVNVPWSAKRINAVYQFGDDGIESLMEEVGRLMGITINNYILLNMHVFMSIVDDMGGVWFDVPLDMDYDDYSMVNGEPYEFTIHVDAGYQRLNGYDALGVFRFRQNNDGTMYPGADWDRIEVQHDLLMEIAKQAMQTRNIVTLMNMVNSVMDNITTDLTLANIQWYLQEFLKMSIEDITFFTMPTDGCWVMKAAYVTINADSWVEMLNEHFAPDGLKMKAENLPLMQARDYEIDRYNMTPTPENYYVTNGDEPYINFPKPAY